MENAFFRIYRSIYMFFYFTNQLVRKAITSIMLPIVEGFSSFPSIEEKLEKRYGSVEKALDSIKRAADTVDARLDYMSVEYPSDKLFFYLVCIFTSEAITILCLIFNWHFMRTILWINPLLVVVLSVLPGCIVNFLISCPSEEHKKQVKIYIKKQSTPKCIKSFLLPFCIVSLFVLCWIIMLYIIFNIMNDNISSYEAIRMFLHDPSCGLNKTSL